MLHGKKDINFSTHSHEKKTKKHRYKTQKKHKHHYLKHYKHHLKLTTIQTTFLCCLRNKQMSICKEMHEQSGTYTCSRARVWFVGWKLNIIQWMTINYWITVEYWKMVEYWITVKYYVPVDYLTLVNIELNRLILNSWDFF